MDEGATGTRAEPGDRLQREIELSWPWQLGREIVACGPLLWESLERELAERAGFQWLAVAFAAGCLIYFLLPREPLLPALLLAACSGSVLAIISYWRGTPWRLVSIAAILLAGVTAGKLRVELLAGPQVEGSVSTILIGRVVQSEDRSERRPRIVLDEIRAERLSPEETPRRIRISLAERHGLPPLGARISLLARVMPVTGPVVPGGYDSRRAAFFESIGGSGFALGGWQLAESPRPSADLWVARIRAAAVARIMAVEPGEAGAVAAALLVGERSELSPETNESLRLSGLAHILSISGLHMMLIAGAAFFAVRALLALSPRLALSRPIRKWAAVAALLVITLYLALSGGGVATVRAYIMAVVMFTAILLDRPAISMRNLAIAAFLVLAMEPESVLEPGFQMSFAAVAALIAAWDVWNQRRIRRLVDEDSLPGWGAARMLGRAVLAVCLSSLVAGLATAPFSAYHFERIASYSLLGNLLAAPLVSAIIMPFGLLTLIAIPLGLEALPLRIMAWGIEILLLVSDAVASLPGAEARAPRMSPASLALLSAGLLWLCLWRLRWRLLGLPLAALGILLLPFLQHPPDILVAPDGKVVAVRDAGGALRVSGGRAGSFVIEQFFDEERGTAPEGATLRQGLRSDELACLLRGERGVQVAHVLDAAAFPEDCRRADVIVTPLPAPRNCAAHLVVDEVRLERFGAHAIRLSRGGEFRIATERTALPRPWQAGGGSREVSISATAR